MLLAHLLIRQPQSCFPQSELLHPGCKGRIITSTVARADCLLQRELLHQECQGRHSLHSSRADRRSPARHSATTILHLAAWLSPYTLTTRGITNLKSSGGTGSKRAPRHNKTTNAGWHHHRSTFKVRKSKCNTRVTPYISQSPPEGHKYKHN